MPVLIYDKKFTDVWGNETTFNRSNAGDKLNLKLKIRSSILLTSSSNPVIFDPFDNFLTSSGLSFEEEGFRVGQSVECQITDVNGANIYTWTTSIDYVNGNVMQISSLPLLPDTTLQQLFQIRVVGTNRQGVECFLNHVENTVPENDYSLIDSEATRFKFSNVASMTVGTTQNATIVGNQSGQYLESASIKRLSNITSYEYQYELSVTFYNSGIYNQEWFDTSECLKAILKTLWSSIEGEPFERAKALYNDEANTGWFDEAHNSDEINAVLVQGVQEIDYANNTAFTLIVDGPVTELGIGSSYVPQNDAYYKNKPLQQGSYGMVIPTQNLSVTTYNSLLNDSGAGYQLKIDDIQVVGSQTFIECVIIPNPNFSTFMESVEDGDRLFYLWVKCGNLNLLAFADQLTTTPPVGGELIMETSKPFYDAKENTNDGSGSLTYNRFDTEDALAYFGTFLMDKGGNYDTFRVRIEAYNTVTEEDFTLKETTFSFAGTQIDSNGIYLVDESTTVNAQLPTTSLKRDAVLTRYDSIDTLTQFGLSIYYPVVLDWRYWLQQLNASTDFYPNQNKNWQQYSLNSLDWVVRMELELIKNGLSFTHSDEITILPYNAKPSITGGIDYIRESDSTTVSGLIDGEIMRIKANRITSLGGWSSGTWGEITIEAKEGAPRWIIYTMIDFDNDTNNPLYPIPGDTTARLTIAGNIATIECLCDTTKLSGGSEYSVSVKIKDPNEPIPPFNKTTSPDDIIKTMSPDDTVKTLA